MDKVQEARTKSAELSRTSAQRHTLELGSVREEADAFAAKQAEAAQKELDAVCDLNASLQAAVVTLETQSSPDTRFWSQVKKGKGWLPRIQKGGRGAPTNPKRGKGGTAHAHISPHPHHE